MTFFNVIPLGAGVADLGLGLCAAAAVATLAPAGGCCGGHGAHVAAAAQLTMGPVAAGGSGRPGRTARGDGLGSFGLDEEAVQGGCGALQHAGGLAGRVGLVQVLAVDHAIL